MSAPAFSVDLGGGLFLDSDGSIHTGPLSSVPVYPLPGGKLPIDPDKVKKVLDGIATAVPDPKDPKKKEEFEKFRTSLGRLGVPDDLIYFAASIGKMAALAASVVPIASFAVGILNLLGVFDAGPDPIEVLINKRFDELEKLVRAFEVQQHLNFVTDKRSPINRTLDDVKEYVEEITKYDPTPARLNQLYAQLEDNLGRVFESVTVFTAETTWLATFDQSTYSQTWGMMQAQVHTHPGGGSATPYPMPPNNQNRFDSRLLPAYVNFAANSYLTILKAFLPEYRTTGAYDGKLRAVAASVAGLAEKMRGEILARTRYTEVNFRGPIWGYNLRMGPLGLPLGVDPDALGWAVGALDLAQHTNGFMANVPLGLVPGRPYKKASLDYRWVPPAAFSPAGDQMYWITNSQACADAANAQAEADYPELLLSSGFLSLVQTAALLRHVATEPDRSETVSGSVLPLRKAGATVDVSVESESIPLAGVIKSAARRESQEFRAHLSLKVQPNRNEMQRAVPYRILLRTFSDARRDMDYGEYYSTEYRSDPGSPDFKRLVVNTQPTWVLGEWVLASGTSRAPDVTPEQTATLEAFTYDWFVPVKTPWATDVQLSDTTLMDALTAMGWSKEAADQLAVQESALRSVVGDGAVPTKVMSHTGNVSPFVDTLQSEATLRILNWQDGGRTWPGEQRHREKKQVEIWYRVGWRNNRVEVELRPRAEDRNYLVFLVVEETLPSGQQLHTAYPVPVVGQLTYVPQSFFDAEKAARDHAARVFGEFTRRYAESVGPGPLDPVTGELSPGDLVTASGLSRVFELAERAQPQILQEVIQAIGVPQPMPPGPG
jgi:hypothetical protein